jgi:AcrR family transcriptional regulator
VRALAYRLYSLYGFVVPRVYPSARGGILDAAERVILRDGPHALSVDAVLAESGLSKGGFFHHFPSKEALLVALLERLVATSNECAKSSMDGDADEHGRSLRAQVALAFDMPAAQRERTRALVLALLAAAMEAPKVALKARIANGRALAEAHREGVDVGTALVVQLALDGYFLGESFGTLRLDRQSKAALRATLLALIEHSAKPRRGALQRKRRPRNHAEEQAR